MKKRSCHSTPLSSHRYCVLHRATTRISRHLPIALSSPSYVRYRGKSYCC
ncbi:hypothetical protein FTW19_16545 [Terriglobus albidus]|uniref:Zinc finger CCCH-type TRM13 domain-containing protein n=1 Tax=Terriglobus albidus TaxID=1592106 RepID=A0A5B9EMZ8_9BACT|nr:hypothetical protein FTW19_16545 [Terriglobus albidus]